MKTSLPSLLMIGFAALNAIIALDLEAEAGHGELEAEFGEYAVHLFHTSAKYHMWHVLGLIGFGALYDLWTDRWTRLAIGLGGLALALGIIFFSGGMYRVPYGGTLTPVIVGAVFQMAGWGMLFIATISRYIAQRSNP